MAAYKVIQDIEAEDKLLGPLTFRQFIYAGIAAIFAYLSYFLITHHAGFMAFVFLPVSLISGFFAWPWGRDQPTEIWALAKIRYLFKPRKRIWDQSGVKELVTVTVPKKVEINYTNGLSQVEVKSRLKVLADTIDSRGWAIKDIDENNTFSQPVPVVMSNAVDENSDRLISIGSMPKAVAADADDIMDNKNSPIARQFDNMMEASAKAHRKQIIDHLQGQPAAASTALQTSTAVAPLPANNPWFLNRPQVATPQDAVTFNAQVVTPGEPTAVVQAKATDPDPNEEELIEEISKKQDVPVDAYSHLHTIVPLSEQPQQVSAPQTTTAVSAPVTQPSNTGILDLASNNDLNVATIQREAEKRRTLQDEVVISLH